jgi:hypothetical protein
VEEQNEEVVRQQRIEEIIKEVVDGHDIRNEDAKLLVESLQALDAGFRIQSTLVDVFVRTIPDMANSLAGDALRRAGRTDQKIKRSVGRMCDSHVESLLAIVGSVANNLIEFNNRLFEEEAAKAEEATDAAE